MTPPPHDQVFHTYNLANDHRHFEHLDKKSSIDINILKIKLCFFCKSRENYSHQKNWKSLWIFDKRDQNSTSRYFPNRRRTLKIEIKIRKLTWEVNNGSGFLKIEMNIRKQHQNYSIPVQKKWELMRVFQNWYQKSKLDTQFSKSLKNRESRSNLKYSIKILKIRMDFWKSLWIFSKSRSKFQSRRIIFWIVVENFKIEIKTRKLYHNFGNWDGFLKIELKNRKSITKFSARF